MFERLLGSEPQTVSPICGSASSRQYFRMTAEDGHSIIGVVGQDLKENAAFIALARHFASCGLPVPEVLAVSADGSAYLQEDLGDLILADLVAQAHKEGSFAPLLPLLVSTMELLAKFQFEGGSTLDYSLCYPQSCFDRRMVDFDLNYFKYCFLKPSSLEFDEIALQNDYESLALDILACADSGNTFLSRDFQSRNVMIRDGKPYFIDFQSGRRGPIHYDLVSFVYQVRAAYPQQVKDTLVDAYIGAVKGYLPDFDQDKFMQELMLFRLFRMLQVLGAYGFRGLVEHKAKFVTSIVPALKDLKQLLHCPGSEVFARYPYLCGVLESLCDLPRFAADSPADGRLEVKVYSFSYKKGIPEDLTGNGGGYVFDCRSIHNPGRYEEYKKLTGLDDPVIRFLEEDGEVLEYLDHVYGVVDSHVRTYLRRGFTNLSISFGCTGGQHRSVYCAEHTARHLAAAFPDARIRLIHCERGLETIFNE